MKKKPIVQKLPPHPLAGYYSDQTGKKYWVPPRPDFALFRCDDTWTPLDPDSPVQEDAAHFQRQLDYNTFSKINH